MKTLQIQHSRILLHREVLRECSGIKRTATLSFAKDAPSGKTHIVEIQQQRQQNKWNFTINYCTISTEISGSSQAFHVICVTEKQLQNTTSLCPDIFYILARPAKLTMFQTCIII